MSPADLARRAIEAADAVEEAWINGCASALQDAAEKLHDARCDARAAGLVECWLSREAVEAVHDTVKYESGAYACRLVARDLAHTPPTGEETHDAP